MNLWDQPGVPHKGWNLLSVEDTGERTNSCEMCRIESIRYVHHMRHETYPEGVRAGCVCAEKMCDDYETPKRVEAKLRTRATRRAKWLQRKWKLTLKGNGYRLRAQGSIYTVTVAADATWYGGACTEGVWRNPVGRFSTWEQAALALFDMTWPPTARPGD